MNTLRLAVTVVAFSTLVACGGGTMTPVDAGPTGNVSAGMTLFAARSCNGCHGNLGEGNATGPNISGSTTAGIGSWTQAEFSKSVKQAISKTGRMYCATMTPYPTLSEQQIADLFAFLMANKNDTVQRGTACP